MQQPIDYNRAHVSPALPVTAKGHPAAMWYLSLARMCERFGYYGMRSVFLLYLTNTVGVDKMHASTIYGTLTTTMYITPVIGGLLGDFVISRKYMMIIGAFIEILGILLMFIPHPAAVAFGFGILAIGSGFTAPNVLAGIGEAYRDREHLSDAGFIILYGMINTGAFLAPLICGLFGESFGYPIAFIIAIVAMGIGQVFLFLYRPTVTDTRGTTLPRASQTWMIAPVLVSLVLFWLFYSFMSEPVYYMSKHAQTSASFSLITSMNAIAVILFTIVFAIAWTFVRISPMVKIASGFVLLAVAIVLVPVFFSQEIDSINVALPVTLMCLQALSELLIVPILYSVFTRHVSRQYMSTAMAFLIGIPWITNYLSPRLYESVEPNSLGLPSLIVAIATLIPAALFLILHFVLKPKRTEPVYTS